MAASMPTTPSTTRSSCSCRWARRRSPKPWCGVSRRTTCSRRCSATRVSRPASATRAASPPTSRATRRQSSCSSRRSRCRAEPPVTTSPSRWMSPRPSSTTPTPASTPLPPRAAASIRRRWPANLRRCASGTRSSRSRTAWPKRIGMAGRPSTRASAIAYSSSVTTSSSRTPSASVAGSRVATPTRS